MNKKTTKFPNSRHYIFVITFVFLLAGLFMFQNCAPSGSSEPTSVAGPEGPKPKRSPPVAPSPGENLGCQPPPSCANVAPGCSYSFEYDQEGCMISCGNLICSTPTPGGNDGPQGSPPPPPPPASPSSCAPGSHLTIHVCHAQTTCGANVSQGEWRCTQNASGCWSCPPTRPATTPSPSPSPSASPGQSEFTFSFPDEFVSRPSANVPGKSYNFNVPPNTPFKKIVVRAEVFHGGWHTVQQGGVLKHAHGLYWITRGSQWGGNVVAYAVAKEATHRMRIGTSIGLPQGEMTGDLIRYEGFFVPNAWYKTEVEYDAVAKTVKLTIQNAQNAKKVVSTRITTGGSTIINPQNFYRMSFGHDIGGGNEPETHTEGWKIKNVRAWFYK